MIRVETAGHVARLVIDRPTRRNAIDAGTARDLGDAIAKAQSQAETALAVVAGNSVHDRFAAATVADAGTQPAQALAGILAR